MLVMMTPEEMESKRRDLEEKRRLKQQVRRKKRNFYIVCAIVGLVLLVLTAFWSYTSRLPAGTAQGDSRYATLLLMGADSGVEGGTRTDTMILFSLDKQTGSVGALSIPRDTRVQIPGRAGFDRVNAAHAYGGPKLAVRTVEQLLGVDINYFVSIDYEGFERIVDALGGVVIDVERPMRYVDTAQNLDINLAAGVQRLDGSKALQYVRYRGDRLGDVALVDPQEGAYAGRVDRQLNFVQALVKQVTSAQGLLKAPQLIREFREFVVTDIPTDEALRLAMAAKDTKLQQIETAILPGVGETVGGASYWVVDMPKAREVVNRLIVHRQGMVRVEVLNGSGMAGVASHAADLLRAQGFEVVAVGNAEHFTYAQTEVIRRRGADDSAADVARALGREWTGDGFTGPSVGALVATDADVTVILGSDFRI